MDSKKITLQNKLGYLRLLVAVIGMIGCFIGLNLISKLFPYGQARYDQPVLIFVIIMISSCLIYYFAVCVLLKNEYNKLNIIFYIGIGLLLRSLMFFSSPILEDDFYRYLWDGAVTANGYDPYKYSPEDVLAERKSVPEGLVALSSQSNDVVRRINHPHLRTIYPPVAQAAFAVAYNIKPWNIISLRVVLLCFDVATLILILLVLKKYGYSQKWIVIYWWNPLLIKEMYNSVHMDLFLLPFILGALLLASLNRHMVSAFLLSLACAVKIWPIVLLPVILRPICRDVKRFASSLMVFSILSCLFFLNGYLFDLGSGSGFRMYAQSWENNSSLFRLLVGSTQLLLPHFGIHPGHGQFLSRIIIMILIIFWTFYIVKRKSMKAGGLFIQSLAIISAIFLLSPTQFPWYYIWIIPFIAIRPSLSLMAITIFLPLYYLRYYFEPRGMMEIFENIIIWIEFVPVWILLFVEYCVLTKNGFHLFNRKYAVAE